VARRTAYQLIDAAKVVENVRNCAQILPANERLYALEYDTFEDYCQNRWDFTRMRASQLIASADVVQNVNNCLQIPANEAQARPLARLEPEEQDTSLLMLQKL
jgi:hypothetical protein